MKLVKIISVSTCATLLLIVCIGIASATEKVNHARLNPGHGFGPNVTDAVAPFWQVDSNAAVDVYTAREVDGIIGNLNQRVDSTRDGLNKRVDGLVDANGVIDQRVQAAEMRLKDQVKTSIDNLPQRLLSDEAKKTVKDAVVAELKEENAQLRQNIQTLQNQDEALKRDIEELKKIIKPSK